MPRKMFACARRPLSAVASLLCAVPLLLGSPRPGSSSQTGNNPPPRIEERVRLIANWNETISTPGALAELAEIKRGEQDGKLMVTYGVRVSGIPANQTYSLFQFPITAAEPTMSAPDVLLQTDGSLCIPVKGCTLVQLAFLPGKGEPFRFLLLSKDGKIKVAAMIVPDPIFGEDQGCRVEAIRVTPKFEAAFLRGKGFKPNEKITYTSISAGETRKENVKADKDGTFNLVLLPAVKGHDAGTDTVTLKGAACAPTVSYNWGSMD